MRVFRLLLASGLLLGAQAWALDLFEAYSKAKSSDPEYLSTYYDYRASLTLPYQAASKMLPQASASYKREDYSFLSAPRYYRDYRAEERTLSFQQTLFNLPAFFEFRQSELRKEVVGLRLKASEQNLIRRVSEAYFDLLYADEALRVVKEEKKALEAQLSMIKRLLDAGEASLTDLHDAEARYSDVMLRIVEAEKDLYTKRRNLGRIIGEEPTDVATLSKDVPWEEPSPGNLEEWIEAAKKNPVVSLYVKQKYVAEYEFRKQRSQRLPVATLFLNYSRVEQSGYMRIQPIFYRTFGIDITLPLLRGGYGVAREKEARERISEAEKEYEKALSDTSQNVVESFLGVKSAVAAISAAKVAVNASEVALVSTRKGYQAGIRTFVDVLNAESNLYKAKLNLVRSVYTWIKNLVSLKYHAGLLKEEDVLEINSWLKAAEQ